MAIVAFGAKSDVAVTVVVVVMADGDVFVLFVVFVVAIIFGVVGRMTVDAKGTGPVVVVVVGALDIFLRVVVVDVVVVVVVILDVLLSRLD